MKLPTIILSVLALLPLHPGHADEREQQLLAQAEVAREQAEAAEAVLLAPAGYGAGVAALDGARRSYQSGGNRNEVVRLAAEAANRFSAAARDATEARRIFATTLQKRAAAREAEAFRIATATWAQAEDALRGAARRLENGDTQRGLAGAAEAARLYDSAELQAIKATILTEARSQLAALRSARAERLAPRTSERAQSLLQQAEAELDADRSRSDVARRLAEDAAAVAANAVALAELQRDIRASKLSTEDLLLEWQDSLARSARAAGTHFDFAPGPRAATDALVAELASLRAGAEKQQRDLAECDDQVRALEEEIRELDSRLEGASNEARDASLRLAAKERAREQLQRLEALFTADEALVLRQGGDLILRLRGLTFASGSARLPATSAALMDKVGRALALYPSARVTVEGHTDSSGNSAANQRLSQARAEAVRDYLVQHLRVSGGQVSAIGYGDTRPIARNEDAAGRRENRRIDLVITPPPEALP